ncbi:MAG: hypothetical protein ACLFVY_09120 [Phycisphaerae bacterium]
MRTRLAAMSCAVTVLAAIGLADAQQIDPNAKARPVDANATSASSSEFAVGFFLRAKVFNESTVVKNFNAQVDAWQAQLDAANKAGDRASAKKIHTAYDKATANLKPSFAKVLEKVLPAVCKAKGVAVAFNGQGQVAWKKADVKTVDLTEPLLAAIAKEVPVKAPDTSSIPVSLDADANEDAKKPDDEKDSTDQTDGWGRPASDDE